MDRCERAQRRYANLDARVIQILRSFGMPSTFRVLQRSSGKAMHHPTQLTPVNKCHRNLRCAALPEEQNLSPAQRAMQERINRAKEYKITKEVTPPPKSGPAPASPASRSDREVSGASRAAKDEYNRGLAAYGEAAAKKQQGTFEAALKDAQGKVGEQTAEVDQEIARQRDLQQRQRQKAMLAQKAARIDQSLHSKVRSGADPAKPDTFSRAREQVGGAASGDTMSEMERRRAAASGSSKEAASYLRRVVQEQSEEAGLRPEQFTIRKDKEVKARGVEFITRDGTYDPLQREQEEGDPAYNPKVSTWGVFARPSNISKAYGGGKTIRPGEALESKEKSQERDARVAAAILDYRKKQGLLVDPEEEAKWSAAYTGGVEMLKAGQLRAAAVRFDEVLEAVPARSKLGGEAQLQKAICMDSAGKNDEAYKLYLTLERHPQADVQKRAKRMLFGFRAAENLKVSTMSYSVNAKGNKDWEKYFTQLTGEWNSGYVDDGEVDTFSTVLALAVIVVPIAITGLLILT